jgi:hypothetical protein
MNPMQSELRRARIAHAANAEDRRHRDTDRRSAQARSSALRRILARGAVGVPGQCLVGQTNPAGTPWCWGGGVVRGRLGFLQRAHIADCGSTRRMTAIGTHRQAVAARAIEGVTDSCVWRKSCAGSVPRRPDESCREPVVVGGGGRARAVGFASVRRPMLALHVGFIRRKPRNRNHGEAFLFTAALDRHWGGGCPPTSATQPCVRARTPRSSRLRWSPNVTQDLLIGRRRSAHRTGPHDSILSPETARDD